MNRILALIIIIATFSNAEKTHVEWAWGADYTWFNTPQKEFAFKAGLALPLKNESRSIALNDSINSPSKTPLSSALPFKMGFAFKLWDGFLQVDGARILRIQETWLDQENYETPYERALEVNSYSLAYRLYTEQKLSIGARFTALQIHISEKEPLILKTQNFNGDTLWLNSEQTSNNNYMIDEFLFQPAFLVEYYGVYFQFKPTTKARVSELSSLPDSVLTNKNEIKIPSEIEVGYKNLFLEIYGKYWLGEYSYDLPYQLSNWNHLKILPRFIIDGSIRVNALLINLAGAWVEGLTTPGSIALFFPKIPFVESQLNFIPFFNVGYQWGSPLRWHLGISILPQASIFTEVSYGW